MNSRCASKRIAEPQEVDRPSTGPRLVLVTRKTPLEQLLERHGTHGQARFYLESRGQTIDWAEEAHERFVAGLAIVQAAIPSDERRVRVARDNLATFLFAPDESWSWSWARTA